MIDNVELQSLDNLDALDRLEEGRLSNVVSLLIPVRPYHIHCAWTQEVPLPAIEEYACRLLVLLDKVLPGDIRQFFGLNTHECDILLESLISNRLAVINDQGFIAPSEVLRTTTESKNGVMPTITKYEERVERPVFDLLTLGIVTARKQRYIATGLPTLVATDEFKRADKQAVMEAFQRQYRAYLEESRKKELEIHRTWLYKISSCMAGDIDQICVDVSISLEPSETGQLRMTKSTDSKSSNGTPISIEMDAKISDFLLSIERPEQLPSLTRYCEMFNDTVLEGFIKNNRLDFNAWLIARSEKKTGYGTPMTQAIIGPIYLPTNRRRIENFLREQSLQWGENQTFNALWLGSSAKLWGANSGLLFDFLEKIESELSGTRDLRGNISAIVHSDRGMISSSFKNVLMFDGNKLENSAEIFIVPDQFAVVQYHCQPKTDSTITVPIGYMTRDPQRIQLIDNELKARLIGRDLPTINKQSRRKLHELMDVNTYLGGDPTEHQEYIPSPSLGNTRIIHKKRRIDFKQ